MWLYPLHKESEDSNKRISDRNCRPNKEGCDKHSFQIKGISSRTVVNKEPAEAPDEIFSILPAILGGCMI
jgi:hypothetical protein